MDLQYYKDAKHNYMIMKTEITEDNTFQHRMLENNKIDGLLPFSLRNMDESYYLYYEIDSKQSLKNKYERTKISSDKLMLFFEGLVKVARNLGDYLLDPCHLVLTPEGIYEELSSGRFYFAYDPDYEKCADKDFIEQLMDYVDMEDENAIRLLSKLLESFCEGDGIDFSFLEKLLMNEKQEKESHIIEEVSSVKAVSFNDIEDEEEYRDDKDTEVNSKKITIRLPLGIHLLMAMLFALVAGALVYLRYAYILTYEENILDITVFMISTMMSLACFILQLRKNDKAFINDKNKENDEDEEKAFSEDIKKQESGKEIKKNGKEPDKIKQVQFEEGEETVLLSLDFDVRGHKLYAEEGSRNSNIDLGKLPLVIGKLSTCSDVIISDKSVSRMHAKIYRPDISNDEIWVQDLNSTNGTFINGKRLMPNERAQIREDDEISFGKCAYAFR